MMRAGFVFFGLILLGCASAEDAELSSRLGHEYERLASEDPSVRDAAEAAIVREGRQAAANIKKRLECEADAEVSARLSRALEQIELNHLTCESWRVTWTAEPIDGPPTAVAVSPDGRWIATCGEFRLRVADTTTLRAKWEVDLEDYVRDGSVAFSRDGGLLFVEMGRKSAPRAWNTSSGEELLGFERVVGAGEYGVWIGPGGTCVVLAEGKWRSGLVAVSDGKRFMACSGEPVSSDGRLFLAGHSADKIPVFVLDPSRVRESAAHPISLMTGKTFCPTIVPSEDFSECAVIENRKCAIFDLESRSTIRSLTADSIAAISGGWVTGSDAGVLTWWKDGTATLQVECGTGTISQLVSVGGLLVMTTHKVDPEATRIVQLRSLDTGALLRESRNASVRGPWGGTMVFEDDRVAVVFANGKAIREFPLHETEERSHGLFAAGGGIVVLPGTRELVMAVPGRPDAGVPIPNFPELVCGVQWTPGGLFAESSSQIVLLDGAGKLVRRRSVGLGTAEGGVFDPTELGLEPTTTLWSTPDGTVAAWQDGTDIRVSVHRDGQEERFLLGLRSIDLVGERVGSSLVALAIDDNGRRLAVIGPSQKEVEVWDLPARKRLHSIELAEVGRIYGLHYAADGDSLVFFSEMASHVWNSMGERMQGVPETFRYLPMDGRWLCWLESDGFHVRDLLRGGLETTFAGPESAKLQLLVLASEDSNRFLALGHEGVWRLDRRDRSATRVTDGRGMRGCVLLAGDLPAFMTDDGVVFLRPTTWDYWTTREDLRGLTIAAAPGGQRFAIVADRRITVYARR